MRFTAVLGLMGLSHALPFIPTFDTSADVETTEGVNSRGLKLLQRLNIANDPESRIPLNLDESIETEGSIFRPATGRGIGATLAQALNLGGRVGPVIVETPLNGTGTGSISEDGFSLSGLLSGETRTGLDFDGRGADVVVIGGGGSDASAGPTGGIFNLANGIDISSGIFDGEDRFELLGGGIGGVTLNSVDPDGEPSNEFIGGVDGRVLETQFPVMLDGSLLDLSNLAINGRPLLRRP